MTKVVFGIEEARILDARCYIATCGVRRVEAGIAAVVLMVIMIVERKAHAVLFTEGMVEFKRLILEALRAFILLKEIICYPRTGRRYWYTRRDIRRNWADPAWRDYVAREYTARVPAAWKWSSCGRIVNRDRASTSIYIIREVSGMLQSAR